MLYSRFMGGVCAFLALGSISLSAGIHTVYSMDEVAKYTEETDEDSLVVFDVDMVIVQPSDPALQVTNYIKQRMAIRKLLACLSPTERDIFSSLYVSSGDLELVDSKVQGILKDLEDRGIKRLALSALLCGKMREIPDLLEWRLQSLAKMNICFSSSFPEQNAFAFDELPCFRDESPQYREGIILSNGENGPTDKGTVLWRFLERLKLKPKKIIFIDDRLQNLKDIENVLEEQVPSLDFIGLHYRGAERKSSATVSSEKVLEKWQTLIDEAKRIS